MTYEMSDLECEQNWIWKFHPMDLCSDTQCPPPRPQPICGKVECQAVVPSLPYSQLDTTFDITKPIPCSQQPLKSLKTIVKKITANPSIPFLPLHPTSIPPLQYCLRSSSPLSPSSLFYPTHLSPLPPHPPVFFTLLPLHDSYTTTTLLMGLKASAINKCFQHLLYG